MIFVILAALRCMSRVIAIYVMCKSQIILLKDQHLSAVIKDNNESAMRLRVSNEGREEKGMEREKKREGGREGGRERER